MFQLRLFDYKEDKEGKFVDIIAIIWIICKKETGLYLRTSIFE